MKAAAPRPIYVLHHSIDGRVIQARIPSAVYLGRVNRSLGLLFICSNLAAPSLLLHVCLVIATLTITPGPR